MHDDFPTPRQAGGTALRYGVVLILVAFGLGMVVWALGVGAWFITKPVNTAVGIVDRVVNPDHALASYRWFHNANQEIAAKQAMIKLSKGALAAAADDRKEARRVELIGTQQRCQALVGQYNARAQRADTVIFMHPEMFLPGDWPGDRNPLPQSISLEVCS